MSSFLQSLSNKNLSDLDKRLLVSQKTTEEILTRSNRLFEIGLREVNEEIKESKEKGLKRAKIYKTARIIISVIGIALICIVPIAVIFNLPFWVPIVVPLVGGLTLSFITNKLRSKEELIRVRYKSLLQYRQRLISRELNVQETWKDKVAKRELKEDAPISRTDLLCKEFGIEVPSKTEDSILSEDISSLNLETPVLLHRYEAGTLSKDTQVLLNAWRMYRQEVLKIKNKGGPELEKSLLELKNKVYLDSGINPLQLPVQELEDELREIKSFCSYGLQIAEILQKSMNKYQITFPLLSLVSGTELDLSFDIENKREEISLLSNKIRYYLKELSLVKNEEEALSIIGDITSQGILPQIRAMIDSSSSLNSSILSRISSYPTNRILDFKQRLSILKLELKNPLWASEWFESPDHKSWKNKLLKFCSFSRKKDHSREKVRQSLLLQVSEKEDILLSIEEAWANFLNNDFAKLNLNNAQEVFIDILKDHKNHLDKKNSNLLIEKINSLQNIFSEEMIGADNESAMKKIFEINEELKVFDKEHLFKLETLISNSGKGLLEVIGESITTRNSTFRKRHEEAVKNYQESIKVSGDLDQISKDLKFISRSYLPKLKSLLDQFEKIEELFSNASLDNKESKLLENFQQVKSICQDFSIQEIDVLKNYLSNFLKKLHLVSNYQREEINHQLIDKVELETKVKILEKQAESEKKEIDRIREKSRSTLNKLLKNIEKQVLGIALSQAAANMVLSLIFFLIIAILGAFSISLNAWWVHLVFLGITVSFIGINFLIRHLMNKKVKNKIEIELQRGLLIFTEIKKSTYPNNDLDRLQKLQGILGLDGIHVTWANKEFLDNNSDNLILERNKEEIIKGLKASHKQLIHKNKSLFKVKNQKEQKILLPNESQEIKEAYVRYDLLEKSINSKETMLDKLLNQQLFQQQELSLLEKEDKNFKDLSLELDKEKKDIVEKQKLVSCLQRKHHFLTNIISAKSSELKEEQIDRAQLLFNDLLDIYKDESLSNKEKKDKSKPIISLIYKEDLFSLVKDLIESRCGKSSKELSISDEEEVMTSIQKEGIFSDSLLKKTIYKKIDYLRSLIQTLEVIENVDEKTSNNSKIINASQQAMFLVENLPVFLKEIELTSLFTPCPKFEESQSIFLEVEKTKTALLKRNNSLEASAINNLRSIFSSLLKNLLSKDIAKTKEALSKLELLISLIGKKPVDILEKEEKNLISQFKKLPFYLLKDIERKNLFELAKIQMDISSYERKLERLSFIKQAFTSGKKESLSIEDHRKILKQKKEKEILESKKLVKEKLQEIKELKQKKENEYQNILAFPSLLNIEDKLSIKKVEEIDHKAVVSIQTASYESLLGKMILSRKEVSKFSSLYNKWKNRDLVHASHMKEMHKKSKKDYLGWYKQLIDGVCNHSLCVPSHLNVSSILEICKKLQKKEQELLNIENKIDDFVLKEENLSSLQEKIEECQRKQMILEEKVSKLKDSQESQEKKVSYLQKMSKLKKEITHLKEEEKDLLLEIEEKSSFKEKKDDCLKEIKILKEMFFSEQ